MEEYPKLINSNDNSTIAINNTSFCIGRSLSCNHIIESLDVSRFHCIIKKEDNKWTLYDRSSNGTYVNSKLYKFNESVHLKNGDVVKLGPSNVSFIFSFKEIQESNENATVKISDCGCLTNHDFPDDDSLIEEAADLLVEGLENTGAEIEISTTPNIPADQISHCEAQLIEANSDVQESSSTERQSQGDMKKANSNETGNSDIMEDELTCSICSELFVKAVTLNCSHTYCKYCIGEWRKTHQTCPICRKMITSIAPTLVLDNFINKYLETQNQHMKEIRQELIKHREELDVNTASSSSIPATNSNENASVIEILSDDDFDDDSDNSYMTDEYDDYEDYVPRRNYYGGYGRCFICNQPGHWANSCPFKRR